MPTDGSPHLVGAIHRPAAAYAVRWCSWRLSYAPKGLGWRHASGAQRGEESSDGADENGGAKPSRPGNGRDHDRPVLDGGVERRRECAGDDADGAAETGEEDGFGEELDEDVAPGGAEGAAEADLGATLENADEHDVGDTHRADEEGDGAEAEEEAVEGAFGFGTGFQRGRRPADGDFAGGCGVGRGGGP